MCKVLKLARSVYYYESIKTEVTNEVEEAVIEIFENNRKVYGTRKIKVELQKRDMLVSRRRIGSIMHANGLVSRYTVKQYRVHKEGCNESKIGNLLARQFTQEKTRKVVVSDLTYVRVGQKWNYICVLLDLHNREIIGYSVGPNKTAELVKEAFMSVKGPLSDIQLFHTDRGNEFKNKLIDDVLSVFKIDRSLSKKGCPYDNACAEATYKIIKTEFVFNRIFESLKQLRIEFGDYVHWFNKIRIHSALGYLSPLEYKKEKVFN